MTIRDILFPMITYPTATAADSIEKAVTLAARLGAHIVGVTSWTSARRLASTHIPSISGAYSRPSAKKAPPMHAISLPPSMTSAHVEVRPRQVPRVSTRSNIVCRPRWLRSSSIMRGYEICLSFPSRQKTRASDLSSRRSSSSPAGRSSYCPKP